jgi:tRNA threonylcarbamoyladenosine biosynthesis protein TsaB
MSDIIILAFDTSTSALSAALYNKGHRSETLINCGDKQSTSQQSSLLIPTLSALLDQASLRYDQVHYFAVTRGPGSFTGIRIGLATVQGLHLATQLPCFTPTSLHILAFQGQQQIPTAASFLALIDNKRGQFYGQIFTNDLHEKEPAQIWSPEALQTYLERSPDHYLVSSATIAETKDRCLVPQTSLATGLIDLLLFLLHKGEIINQDLSPFYLVNPVYAKRHPHPVSPSE